MAKHGDSRCGTRCSSILTGRMHVPNGAQNATISRYEAHQAEAQTHAEIRVEIIPLRRARPQHEKNKRAMKQIQEQLDKLFTDLASRLKKYGPSDQISFCWVFESNEDLAAFEADPRFRDLCGDCEKKKSIQLHTMKPVLKYAITAGLHQAVRARKGRASPVAHAAV
jgi:hypothetical protein